MSMAIMQGYKSLILHAGLLCAKILILKISGYCVVTSSWIDVRFSVCSFIQLHLSFHTLCVEFIETTELYRSHSDEGTCTKHRDIVACRNPEIGCRLTNLDSYFHFQPLSLTTVSS